MKEMQEDNNRGKDVVAVEKKPKGGLKQKKKKNIKKGFDMVDLEVWNPVGWGPGQCGEGGVIK